MKKLILAIVLMCCLQCANPAAPTAGCINRIDRYEYADIQRDGVSRYITPAWLTDGCIIQAWIRSPLDTTAPWQAVNIAYQTPKLYILGPVNVQYQLKVVSVCP